MGGDRKDAPHTGPLNFYSRLARSLPIMSQTKPFARLSTKMILLQKGMPISCLFSGLMANWGNIGMYIGFIPCILLVQRKVMPHSREIVSLRIKKEASGNLDRGQISWQIFCRLCFYGRLFLQGSSCIRGLGLWLSHGCGRFYSLYNNRKALFFSIFSIWKVFLYYSLYFSCV